MEWYTAVKMNQSKPHLSMEMNLKVSKRRKGKERKEQASGGVM